MLSGLGLQLFLVGYSLMAIFIVIERLLRKNESAKSFQRGASDRGSTLLIGSAFGVGLLLPLIMNAVDLGPFLPIDPVEGFVALAITILGIGLRVWAARTLGKFYTRTLLTTEEQKLIATGPYAKIRHPGYLGNILLWCGFGVLSSNLVVALLFPVMFVAAYLYRISVEERMLAGALGDDYAEYRKRTYRLVPLVY
jgi:protein-S-isoprenylcysteine O-methyltransferase Ste14